MHDGKPSCFCAQTQRKKDGKTHVYWSIVENKRLDEGRVVQRQVLYLGEINSSQTAAWRKAIEVVDESTGEPRTLALFPEDGKVAARDADTFRFASRRCGYAGRANGAPAGSPDSCGATLNWIVSGRNDCRAAAKGRGGTRCCRCWRPTG